MDAKDKIIVQKVKQEILSIDKDAEVVLFGSRARGDAKQDSDWDFLVLTDLQVTFSLREKIALNMLPIELDEGVILQVVPRNKNDWQTKYAGSHFYLNVKEEGIKV